ncbi:related to tRNA-dihydrouridine(20) synthase [NAD(P)+] [Saccharomycodes ludwigii]|uniref:Related to tRNA-dihydrouridine(20) synthase [NAD(P)+] n=1 Tax=Saccharomycodes ludwigii TaxID=36035 RepID=A0A376B6N9_9ASCO|nr:related to tRNA-dihydrouridine(20) synthase [NAD(P)+] [Saccharomycodes ludwigii]
MVVYTSKLCLAPMVRAGELPTRLLALRYGADLVWGPEIIDKKLVQCKRVVNNTLNTIDFVAPNHNKNGDSNIVVFRTYPKEESGKLIFQLGTSTPSIAVEATSKIIKDVDGIDVNAGCPKHFSIHSGMGAALLKTPDKLCTILKELVEKIGNPNNKPISVKIRILDHKEDTLTLVEKLCQTGIKNLTVHCRTPIMRNRELPIRDYIPFIFDICEKNGVSLIMNGGLKNRKHFFEIKEKMNLNNKIGGMFADCAEANPSIFSESPLYWFQVVKDYIEVANQFDHSVHNVKYSLTRIIPGKSKLYQLITRSKSLEEINHILTNYILDSKTGEADKVNAEKYLNECREKEKIVKQELNKLKQEQAKHKLVSDIVDATNNLKANKRHKT